MYNLQIALKCSDLGHLTSSVEVHKQWVARLEEVSLVKPLVTVSQEEPEAALYLY